MPAIEKEIADLEGYVVPHEGERHLATIVLLPFRGDTWREKAKPALDCFEQVLDAIRAFERVVLVIHPELPVELVSRFQKDNVTILRLPYDDSWARDNTPIFLRNGERLVGADFGFNSWGGQYDGLYPDYEDDNCLSQRILLELRIPRHARKDFILEGGNILSDGEGTILTSRECQLSPGRNPSLCEKDIEAVLKQELNAKKVLFLPYGIVDDETNGHVDNIASFLDPGVVCLASCDDPDDPQHSRCQEDLEYLRNQTDACGRPLQILLLPLPQPQYLTWEESQGVERQDGVVERREGRRLAASYCNFYQGKDFLLLPQFGVPEDEVAKKILEDYYQGRKKIVPIKSREILLGGGNIHCITKEIPYSPLYPIEPEETK